MYQSLPCEYPFRHCAGIGSDPVASTVQPLNCNPVHPGRLRERLLSWLKILANLVIDLRTSSSAADRGLPGLPWCASVPVRRACRTAAVPLAVELMEGHGAGGETGARPRRPDAAGLEDRAPGWPGCWPGACGPRAIRGREADASRNHRAGRGSGRRPDARERRGGAGRCGPGSPGYRRVRLPGASRPVVPSR